MISPTFTPKLLLYGILLSSITIAQAQDEVEKPVLQPFTTDGCSAFPDGNAQQQDLWLDCCVAHDRAYWLGGTYSQRQEADEELRHCVDDLDQITVAAVMLVGVRLGGSPFFPTPYRWGYGWPYPRGYKALTAEELAQAQTQLSKNND